MPPPVTEYHFPLEAMYKVCSRAPDAEWSPRLAGHLRCASGLTAVPAQR